MNTVKKVFICPPGRYLTFILPFPAQYCTLNGIESFERAAPFRAILVLVAIAARVLARLVSQLPQRELRAFPHGSFDAHPPHTARCLAFLFRLPCRTLSRQH